MASTLLARDRSFGGKAGIWFRKRKIKTRKELGALDFDYPTGGGKYPKKGSAPLDTVIGWDEIRCRPIYKDSKNNVTNNDDSDEDEDNDHKCSESPSTVVGNLEEYSTVQLSEKPKALSEEPEVRINKVRSYGRKRICTVEENYFAENLEPLNYPSNIKEKENTFTASVPSEEETAADIPEPRRVSSDFTEGSTGQLGDRKDNDEGDSVFEFNEQKQHAPEMESSDCKTPAGRVFAPSSSTSLSAARAFFRQLDSEQLNLTQELGATPKRRATVRTQRKASLSDQQLLKEFSDYTAACEASQVSPLSIEDYISNRGSYFRSMEMYDGFLDE